MNTPAFQFYPQDFLIGTSDMDLQEVGLYIRVLSLIWTRGGDGCELEYDVKKLSNMTSCTPTKFKKVFKKIEEKFTFFEKKIEKNSQLFFTNEKLFSIKKSQNEYREKQRKNIEKRWNKGKKEESEGKEKSIPPYSSGNTKSIPTNIPNAYSSSSSSKKINKLGKFLKDLKKQIGIENFNDSRSYQEDYAQYFLEMIDDIGEEEFERRLKRILERPKKAEQCNKINFVYREIKNYVATEQDQQKAKSAESRKRIEAERKAKMDEEDTQKKKDEAVRKWIEEHPKEFETRLKQAVEEVKYGGTISTKTALAKAKIKTEIAKELEL